MILVDSSVWIDHLHRGDTHLRELLLRGEVVMHPFILGEIALGSLANRSSVLHLLANLPQIAVALPGEILHAIATEHLFGRGVGYVDVHLLISLRLSPRTTLWTRDRRLAATAKHLALPLLFDRH